MVDTPTRGRGGALHIPRSRGAASGLLVIVLGLWGALVPFIGPYFNFAFSPDQAWTWTAGRGRITSTGRLGTATKRTRSRTRPASG